MELHLLQFPSNRFHFLISPSPPLKTPSKPPLPAATAGRSPRDNKKEKVEIRVCVNRTCSRQGSRDIHSVLSDITPPSVSVSSCGCLGRCGAGPNIAVLPQGVLVSHCGTPARAAELLAEVLRGEGRFDPRTELEALALRKKGEIELVDKGNAAEAVVLFSQAFDLKPSGGLHVLYKSRF